MNLEELKSERKKVKDKLTRIKKYDKLELLRLHLSFDYREIRHLLNERKKELTKEINKLVVKEKRESEVKINLIKEFNYIKNKGFKDYEIPKPKIEKNRLFFGGYYMNNCDDLLKLRKNIAYLINKYINGKFGNWVRYTDEMIEDDFYKNTMKDPKYSKIIENMTIKKL